MRRTGGEGIGRSFMGIPGDGRIIGVKRLYGQRRWKRIGNGIAILGRPLRRRNWGEVEGIAIGASSLRRWLIEEGLWEGKRKRRVYRSRRERRSCFGELLQFDGSHLLRLLAPMSIGRIMLG